MLKRTLQGHGAGAFAASLLYTARCICGFFTAGSDCAWCRPLATPAALAAVRHPKAPKGVLFAMQPFSPRKALSTEHLPRPRVPVCIFRFRTAGPFRVMLSRTDHAHDSYLRQLCYDEVHVEPWPDHRRLHLVAVAAGAALLSLHVLLVYRVSCMSCHAMPCHTIPRHAIPCHAVSCHTVSYRRGRATIMA